MNYWLISHFITQQRNCWWSRCDDINYVVQARNLMVLEWPEPRMFVSCIGCQTRKL